MIHRHIFSQIFFADSFFPEIFIFDDAESSAIGHKQLNRSITFGSIHNMSNLCIEDRFKESASRSIRYCLPTIGQTSTGLHYFSDIAFDLMAVNLTKPTGKFDSLFCLHPSNISLSCQ